VTESAFVPAAEVLLKAESRLRLLDRVVPANLERERARLLAALQRGSPAIPAFRYARLDSAAELRQALLELSKGLSGRGFLGELFAGRAEELALEAALVEALGSPGFLELARQRFPSPSAAEAAEVDALVRRYSQSLAEPASFERIESDASDPRSLVRVLERSIAPLAGRVRVELRRELGSVAAAGDGVVFVRPGVELSAREAERIARHELEAHVLPRLAARSESCPIYRAGSRGASEDEEGRALTIEERSGLLGPERRQELALRHCLATEVRAGATVADSWESARGSGLDAARALDAALRAHRGGGLGREIVYLTAFLRVRAAFAAEPWLEGQLARGRVSLAAARTLEAHEASASAALYAQGTISSRTGA
jgi:hypothetical protein